MKFSKLVVLAALAVGVNVFAGTVSCVSDERAVDGGLVKFDLTIDDSNGAGVAQIYEESNSPAASSTETTELRALTCKVGGHAFTSIECQGPFRLSISEMELAPPPGGNFTHRTMVSTTFKDKNFSFGGPAHKPLVSECKFDL